MKNTHRLIAGLVVGCVSAVAIASAGFSVLRALWPEYAAAEPEKAYTLAMLFSRLSIGAPCARLVQLVSLRSLQETLEEQHGG